MGEKQKGKFGVTGYKLMKGQWSIGIAITHDEYETYLYVNLINGILQSVFLICKRG